jgi:hypothetical protein
MNHFKLAVASVSGKSIGVLTFDLQNEKVNKFNRPVMEEFKVLIADLKTKTN